jgi:hypothetical protein
VSRCPRHPVLIVASAVALVMLLAGCVGPATTVSAYTGKALHAAQAAESEVQTVRLAVDQNLKGKLQQAYLETMLSDSEDAMSSVENSFDSIQPPDNAVADKLRDDLDKLLSDSSDTLSQLRIEARRQDADQMAQLLSSLKPLAAKLDDFSKEHGG